MNIRITLIPIPPPNPTGPDPPSTIYHYTTGSKLKHIINFAAIKPSTANVPGSEKPVAWFSTMTCSRYGQVIRGDPPLP